MTVNTKKPTSAPRGQSSDSHVHLDPAIHTQGSATPGVDTAFPAGERALFLLEDLRTHQERLPRPAALAWERAVFAEVFDHPGPGLRIRRFLDKDLE